MTSMSAEDDGRGMVVAVGYTGRLRSCWVERNASLEEEVVEKDEREDEAEAGELRTNCDDGMFAGRPYLSRTMPGSWSLARKKQASASSAS